MSYTTELRKAAEALDDVRRPIEEARAAAAERIAARRAENAARAAAAHALAMAAPCPVLSADDLRDLKARQRRTRARQVAALQVTEAFGNHPRTMAEVLARAAAYREARDGR